MGGNIFISYRREDTEGYAGRVYDRLCQEFGSDRVFMDVDDIDAGEDFVNVIDEAVRGCRVLIALIGTEWVTAKDTKGLRRLDNPDDFVHLEIASALRRDILVIPVLVHGAVMPVADDLPEDLLSLLRRNALEIRHNRFSKDINDLIEVISRFCEPEKYDQNNERVLSRIKKIPSWGWGGLIVAGILSVWFILIINDQKIPFLPGTPSSQALNETATPSPTVSPTETETLVPKNTLPPSFTATITLVPSSTPTTESTPIIENTPTITTIPLETIAPRGVISVTMVFIPKDGDEFGNFYVDQYPVTNDQFVEFLNWFKPSSPSRWFSVAKSEYLIEEEGLWQLVNSDDAKKPVVWVTWYGADRFCKWIKGRLPLEAEWEKAAGLGFNDRKYPWGDNIDCRYANYFGCSYQRVIENSDCSRNFSPYNVCDLAGNAAEWVDGYDPQKGESEAILKGGSYRTDEYYLEIDKSLFRAMNGSEKDTGFRCVVDKDP